MLDMVDWFHTYFDFLFGIPIILRNLYLRFSESKYLGNFSFDDSQIWDCMMALCTMKSCEK